MAEETKQLQIREKINFYNTSLKFEYNVIILKNVIPLSKFIIKLINYLILFFVINSCSTIEKKGWNDSSVFIEFKGNHPIIELIAYPSEKNYAPPVKLRFLLDTGSNLSFIKKEFIPIKKPPEKYISYTISGSSEVSINKLSVDLETTWGDKIATDQIFHIIDFKRDFPFDGILGNDILQKYTLLYNHPEGLYVFFNEPRDLEKGFTPLNVLSEIKTHIVIPVELEKTLIYFLIDTGAEISYLDEEHIKKLNLDSIATRKYTNFTGDIRESNTYIVPNLCLREKLCSQNVELLSNQNLRQFLGQNSVKVSGLFGMNWLKNYYLLVRYPDRKVFLKSKRI